MDAKLTIEFRKIIFKYVQRFKTSDVSFDFETNGQTVCICILNDCMHLKNDELQEEELKFIANRLGDLLSDYCDKPASTLTSLAYSILKVFAPYCSLMINGFKENSVKSILAKSSSSDIDKAKILFSAVLNMNLEFRNRLTNLLNASCDLAGYSQSHLVDVEYPRYYIKDENDKFVLVSREYIKVHDGIHKIYYVQNKPNDHLYEQHNRCRGSQTASCPVCDGGLSVCGICGQVECDLTTSCPGHKSYGNCDVDSNVYNGHDFVYGLWVAGFKSCPRSADEELNNFYAVRDMISKGYKLNVEDSQTIVDFYRGRGLGWDDDRLANLTIKDLEVIPTNSVLYINDMIKYPNKLKLGGRYTKAILGGINLSVYHDDIVTLLLNIYDDVFKLASGCKEYDIKYILDKSKLSNSCILIYINSIEDMYFAKSIIDIANDLNIYFFTTDYVDELKQITNNYKEFTFE